MNYLVHGTAIAINLAGIVVWICYLKYIKREAGTDELMPLTLIFVLSLLPGPNLFIAACFAFLGLVAIFSQIVKPVPDKPSSP